MWEEGKKMDDARGDPRRARRSGLDGARVLARIQDQEVKDRLLKNTEASVARGTFGAPTFFVGDEIFFGKDRLRDVEEEIVAAKAGPVGAGCSASIWRLALLPRAPFPENGLFGVWVLEWPSLNLTMRRQHPYARTGPRPVGCWPSGWSPCGCCDPLVLALPRGGVPVGAEIARRLHAPLDIVFVRKLGAPEQPELAVGAVADGSEPEIVLNAELVATLDLGEDYIAAAAKRELAPSSGAGASGRACGRRSTPRAAR